MGKEKRSTGISQLEEENNRSRFHAIELFDHIGTIAEIISQCSFRKIVEHFIRKFLNQSRFSPPALFFSYRKEAESNYYTLIKQELGVQYIFSLSSSFNRLA